MYWKNDLLVKVLAQIQADAQKKIAEQNPESSKPETKPAIPQMPWNNEHQIKFDRRKTKKLYHGQIHSIDNMMFRLQSIDNHMADISGYLKTLVEKQNDSSGDWLLSERSLHLCLSG